MRDNPVKRKLLAAEVSFGTFAFEFDTTGRGRIAASAGAEFMIFDMEHTGWSIERVRTLLATTRSEDIVPLVRVPAADYQFLARVLDMGAMGIMIPMVETLEQARTIVDSTRYPPEGRRGTAMGISHDDYEGGRLVEKQQSANRERLVIAQIETAKGLDNVEEIGALDGIDVLWVGQSDLTTSLGIPGQFDHPTFLGALDRIAEVARKNGKAAGYMAMSVEEGVSLIERGFRAIAYSGDLYIYKDALAAGLRGLRERTAG